MLYVYHGSDSVAVTDKANAAVSSIKKKRQDVQVFVFEGAFADIKSLDELIDARGLFVEKHVVVLKQPFETKESMSAILERAERIAQSENIFIIAEEKIDAASKKTLEAHATRVEEHARAVKTKDQTGFALSDALGVRDRRALWTEYIMSLRSGAEPETLHGSLAWAARCMVLAARYASAEEAGLSPFVYGKFRRLAHKYTDAERLEISHTILALYHDAHRGVHDLATATERWILTL